MSRSIKKGPHVDFKLLKKIEKMEESKKKGVIKTWARNSIITPDSMVILFTILADESTLALG